MWSPVSLPAKQAATMALFNTVASMHMCQGTDANAALGTESDSLVGDSNVNGQTG